MGAVADLITVVKDGSSAVEDYARSSAEGVASVSRAGSTDGRDDANGLQSVVRKPMRKICSTLLFFYLLS